jgi:hypothetical protein
MASEPAKEHALQDFNHAAMWLWQPALMVRTASIIPSSCLFEENSVEGPGREKI